MFPLYSASLHQSPSSFAVKQFFPTTVQPIRHIYNLTPRMVTMFKAFPEKNWNRTIEHTLSEAPNNRLPTNYVFQSHTLSHFLSLSVYTYTRSNT